MVQGKALANIAIPNPGTLHSPSYFVFLSRDTSLVEKRKQDLQDWSDLSNIEPFSQVLFQNIIRRFGLTSMSSEF